ncbi:MAG: hypothetical protein J7K26_01890 [Candidatus Aenigmarchaeota archaeon]|nr:hypothetical protein [Candidatus Aenigmarchaeota archaeon]
MARFIRTRENKKIAKERIEILEKMIKKYPEFADRYKYLINKIKKKYKV